MKLATTLVAIFGTSLTHGWVLDSSCEPYKETVTKGMKGAFSLNDAASGTFDQLSRSTDGPTGTAQRDLLSFMFAEALTNDNVDTSNTEWNNVKEKFSSVKDYFKVTDDGSPETTPANYKLLTTVDLVVYCDYKRFNESEDCDGNRAKGSACDTSVGRVVDTKGIYSNCKKDGFLRDSVQAWTVEWSSRGARSPSQIQLCPPFLKKIHEARIKTVDDQGPTHNLAREGRTVTSWLDDPFRTPMDEAYLLDGTLLHELTHAIPDEATVDVKGSGSYGWKACKGISGNNAPKNADSYALFGLGAKLISARRERPMKDGTIQVLPNVKRDIQDARQDDTPDAEATVEIAGFVDSPMPMSISASINIEAEFSGTPFSDWPSTLITSTRGLQTSRLSGGQSSSSSAASLGSDGDIPPATRSFDTSSSTAVSSVPLPSSPLDESPSPDSPVPGASSSSPPPADLPSSDSPSFGLSSSGPSATDSSPAGTIPANSAPAGSSPADATPAGSSPAGPSSADLTPANSSPANTTPTGSVPAGSSAPGVTPPASPAGSSPDNTIPAASSPADSPPAGWTPDSSFPAGASPAGSTPAGSSASGSSAANSIPAGVSSSTSGPDSPPSPIPPPPAASSLGSSMPVMSSPEAGPSDNNPSGANPSDANPSGSSFPRPGSSNTIAPASSGSGPITSGPLYSGSSDGPSPSDSVSGTPAGNTMVTVTSGSSISVEPATVISVSKSGTTSPVTYTPTYTSSDDVKPTMAWMCTGPLCDTDSGCVVPLFCESDGGSGASWGLCCDWEPLPPPGGGPPPAGGPSPGPGETESPNEPTESPSSEETSSTSSSTSQSSTTNDQAVTATPIGDSFLEWDSSSPDWYDKQQSVFEEAMADTTAPYITWSPSASSMRPFSSSGGGSSTPLLASSKTTSSESASESPSSSSSEEPLCIPTAGPDMPETKCVCTYGENEQRILPTLSSDDDVCGYETLPEDPSSSTSSTAASTPARPQSSRPLITPAPTPSQYCMNYADPRDGTGNLCACSSTSGSITFHTTLTPDSGGECNQYTSYPATTTTTGWPFTTTNALGTVLAYKSSTVSYLHIHSTLNTYTFGAGPSTVLETPTPTEKWPFTTTDAGGSEIAYASSTPSYIKAGSSTLRYAFGAGPSTIVAEPTASAKCLFYDQISNWLFVIYDINHWDVDMDELGATLKDEEKGCGALTAWDYEVSDEYGPIAKFALPFFMDEGCVEKAIGSAGGPDSDDISCQGDGPKFNGPKDSAEEVMDSIFG